MAQYLLRYEKYTLHGDTLQVVHGKKLVRSGLETTAVFRFL